MLLAVSLAAALGVVGCFWPWGAGRAGLRLPGIVETQEVRLASKVGGRVAEVAVREGEQVQAGHVLVRFETPELTAQRRQTESKLRRAEADLAKARNGPRKEEKEAAQAAVEAARARWRRLETGWREEEIRQAIAEQQTAEADRRLAQESYDRATRLFPQRSVSRADLDAAKAALDRSQGRFAAARAHMDMLTTGTRKEDIDEAAAELKRAEAGHRLLLAGTRPEEIAAAEATVLELKAKLTELDAQLAEAEVRAPTGAVIEVVAVRKGDVLAPNQPVVRILQAEDLWVKVYVPETELGKLRLQQPAEVTVDAYPERRFAGRVIQVASISEFTPRNVQSLEGRRHQVFGVKVAVDTAQGVFKAGMAAEVYFPLAAPASATPAREGNRAAGAEG